MSLLGAVYTAVSGMNAFSDGLQTVSTNVANLNTNGYKADDIAFSDLFDPSSGASSFQESDDQSGGGVKMTTPFMDFSQGTLQQTGNALDLAIQGNGFLVVQNDGNNFYERTGSFALDSKGFISDQANGYHLTVLNGSNQPVALNLNDLQTNPPSATTKIAFTDNLSSSATTASVSTINVFDSTGAQQTWTATFNLNTPSGTSTDTSQWTVTITDSTGATVGTGTIGFIGSSIDPATSTFTVSQTPTDGATPLNVTLDFSGVTSFSAGTASTITTSSVDGFASGSLSGISITQAGQVQLTYSNGQTKNEGLVAMASFADPEQLQRLGNGVFANTANAAMSLGGSGTSALGTIESGNLESSNVNLSNEFSLLILIERGYQACSEVLSVSNEMIQQLYGIRGQGG